MSSVWATARVWSFRRYKFFKPVLREGCEHIVMSSVLVCDVQNNNYMD